MLAVDNSYEDVRSNGPKSGKGERGDQKIKLKTGHLEISRERSARLYVMPIRPLIAGNDVRTVQEARHGGHNRRDNSGHATVAERRSQQLDSFI
jgi:hypothetical protein